jgi:hypothetical protein
MHSALLCKAAGHAPPTAGRGPPTYDRSHPVPQLSAYERNFVDCLCRGVAVVFLLISPVSSAGGCKLPGGSHPATPGRRYEMSRADLCSEDGRSRWRKWFRRLSGWLSFLFTVYRIVREISSHL